MNQIGYTQTVAVNVLMKPISTRKSKMENFLSLKRYGNVILPLTCSQFVGATHLFTFNLLVYIIIIFLISSLLATRELYSYGCWGGVATR